MSNLSVYIDNLSVRTKSLTENAASFHASTKEEQQNMLQATKQKAKAQRKAFLDKIGECKKQTRTFWETLQKQHRKSLKKGKKNFIKFKKKIEAKDAERYASIVEEDAMASILFAMNSIVEAERLVMEALQARAEAEASMEIVVSSN